MRVGNREFSPRLIPTVATAVLLPILLSLGFWQLDRAEQRRLLLQQFEQQQAGPVLNLNDKLVLDSLTPYQRVKATGRFDVHQQFLLDNKVYQGRAGYQVITPLILADGNRAILVNRGWLPQKSSRQELPDIPTPMAQLELEGRLKLNPGDSFKLGESGFQNEGWPKVVQWLELEELEKSLGYKLEPFVVLQDANSPGGFVRDWYIKKITPEKNISYAVQWFALALALIIIYLVVNLHKLKEVGSSNGIE